jgi:hypothetical protein
MRGSLSIAMVVVALVGNNERPPAIVHSRSRNAAYDRGMHKRVFAAAAVALAALSVLAGCQAKSGAFTRSDAIASVATWTRSAESAAGSPRGAAVSAGSENCRSDTGFLVTHFQWRTITDLAIPRGKQATAIAAITKAFADAGWSARTKAEIVSMSGPKDAKRRGIVRLESGGDSRLSVAVTSPCFS